MRLQASGMMTWSSVVYRAAFRRSGVCMKVVTENQEP